jgi:DNA-binding MarR family transcriptional regulator
MDKYNSLKLENQLCFPLYACSKEIIRNYKPFLDKIDLTYTQYITMMVLWEKKSINVKDLGEQLYLDSGTLTPLLKKMESKGYITRNRSDKDERNLIIKVTDKGMELRDEALDVPKEMKKCIRLTSEEASFLYKILYKMINKIEGEDNND